MIPVSFVDEDLARSEIVVRRVEAHDEVAREEIVADHLVLRVGVDEDVRERGRGIPDIGAAIEDPEE
jgi:hypothetical protein